MFAGTGVALSFLVHTLCPAVATAAQPVATPTLATAAQPGATPTLDSAPQPVATPTLDSAMRPVAAAMQPVASAAQPTASSAAHADEGTAHAGGSTADTAAPSTATPPLGAPAQAVVLDGYMGVGRRLERERWDTTMHIGVTGLYRIDWATFGVGGELSSLLFEDNSQLLGALAGATFQVANFMQVAALAEFGVHFEQPAEGLDLFGETEIRSSEFTAVPYAGVRLNPLLRLGGRNRNRFLLGPTLLARKDLAERSGTYTEYYCSDGWFSTEPSCSTSQKENPVGGLHFVATVMAGLEFGR